MQESESEAVRPKATPFQLVWLVLATVVLAAVGSHAAMRVLGIREENPIRRWTVSAGQTSAPALMLGSSLTYLALSLSNVSAQLQQPLECRWIPSASTCELEGFIPEVPGATTTVISVSLYDQNERILCDYRSEIVPLAQTVRDLWDSGSEWNFAKRILSQYPSKHVRKLFPTAGRSLLVMIATKARVLAWINGTHLPAQMTDVNFDDATPGSIADWTPAHLLDQATLVRHLCQGLHEFDGPKLQAFQRIVAGARGRVIVIILPVSPEYRRALLTSEALQQFEKSLAVVRAAAPKAEWLRLDQLPELNDNACYRDLAHMNPKGKRLATEAVGRALTATPR